MAARLHLRYRGTIASLADAIDELERIPLAIRLLPGPSPDVTVAVQLEDDRQWTECWTVLDAWASDHPDAELWPVDRPCLPRAS